MPPAHANVALHKLHSGAPAPVQKLVASLHELVSEDLAVGFYPHTPPPLESSYVRPLVEATLLRVGRPRGRNEEEIEMRDSAQDLAQAVARFFNSDWTKPQV